MFDSKLVSVRFLLAEVTFFRVLRPSAVSIIPPVLHIYGWCQRLTAPQHSVLAPQAAQLSLIRFVANNRLQATAVTCCVHWEWKIATFT